MTQQDIELGRFTANSHTNLVEGNLTLLRIANAAATNDILISAKDTTDTSTTKIEMVSSTGAQVNIDLLKAFGKVLSIREVEVCVGGVTNYMLVIGSAPYFPRLTT